MPKIVVVDSQEHEGLAREELRYLYGGLVGEVYPAIMTIDECLAVGVDIAHPGTDIQIHESALAKVEFFREWDLGPDMTRRQRRKAQRAYSERFKTREQ